MPRIEPDPQVRVVEEIVAKVNSDIITRGELAKQRAELQAELQTSRVCRAKRCRKR